MTDVSAIPWKNHQKTGPKVVDFQGINVWSVGELSDVPKTMGEGEN